MARHGWRCSPQAPARCCCSRGWAGCGGRGEGLPMNAFPPPRLVTSGVYSVIPHPIYTGFCLLCVALAMAARSRSGLWLVCPVVMLGCVSLVLGYERPDLDRRFGEA